MTAVADRVATFQSLHTSGCFVMPNPWDAGSAKALEQMGFKALASTSAGFAWTLGRGDDRVTLEETLEHLRLLVDAVSVPVNADFKGGFAVDPQLVGENVKLAVATGILALACLAIARHLAHPPFENSFFLTYTLFCALGLSTLLLLPSALVGRIAARGGSRRDGDVAMAIFASYVIGQFMPLFY